MHPHQRGGFRVGQMIGQQGSALGQVGLGKLLRLAIAAADRPVHDVGQAVGPAKASQLQIIADQRTPFRTLAEVLYTLGQSEFQHIHFVVLEEAPHNRD